VVAVGRSTDIAFGQPASGVVVHVDDVTGWIGHTGMGVGDFES
jgi:hypothetical protein